MCSIPQYVKRGASGRVRHPVPTTPEPQPTGLRAVFAVSVHIGLIVFFTIMSTALYVLLTQLVRGGV